jgi:ParB family transcriptional regulator, chromosome partitioning protein
MTEIPLSLIDPDPEQPRKRFDPQALEELAASIRENGCLQPICLRVVGERYQIVAGERRWRAHVLAKLPTIPAVIIYASAEQARIASIVENLQRVDITPLEEAHAYQQMLDAGLTVCELAKRLGLKQPWRITERISLLKLDCVYRDLFAQGHLSPSQAYELSRLGRDSQRRLFELIKTGRCETNGKLRAAADGLLALEKQDALFVLPAPTPEEQAKLTALEAKIERVCEILAAGFKDNEVVLLKKINPHRAAILAEELALIQRSLALLEKSLAQAAVQDTLSLRQTRAVYH